MPNCFNWSAISSIATSVGVIAALVFSIISACQSSKARNAQRIATNLTLLDKRLEIIDYVDKHYAWDLVKKYKQEEYMKLLFSTKIIRDYEELVNNSNTSSLLIEIQNEIYSGCTDAENEKRSAQFRLASAFYCNKCFSEDHFLKFEVQCRSEIPATSNDDIALFKKWMTTKFNYEQEEKNRTDKHRKLLEAMRHEVKSSIGSKRSYR